jgi:SNF2 family DNA or RNA helicase
LTVTDIRLFSDDGRAAAAWRAHEAEDFELPRMKWFNSAPCPAHGELGEDPLCQKCGIELRRHQRTGTMWMYAASHSLLADIVGSGKTAVIAGVLALCKETGELGPDNRAVVVCQAAAVGQWARELRRFLPGITVLAADQGTPAKRVAAYSGTWEVVVVSGRTFASAGKVTGDNYRPGDVDRLLEFPVGILIYDDLDEMRSLTTKTFSAVMRMAQHCGRVHGLHGTPLQKRLHELYAFLGPVGGRDIFGSGMWFRQRYVSTKPAYFHQRANVCPDDHLTLPPYRRCQVMVNGRKCLKPCFPDPTHRKLLRRVNQDIGIKEHMLPEFQRKIAPVVLRRVATDMDDVNLPEVQHNPVWLELSPQQKKRYAELRTGVLRRLRDTGVEITQVEAAAAFVRGAQICSGLAALDDGKDISVKLDWVEDKIIGDLAEDKCACFIYFRENVRAMSARLEKHGVGHVILWSEETDPRERDRRILAFQTDPAIRVILGTTTMERSLNLQAARHLIAVDTILNPARMEQVVGRVKRQGSAHSLKIFHQLFASGTQEDGYLDLLRAEQAMADAVWDEAQGVYSVPQLGPRSLMKLVATGQSGVRTIAA